ncbi:MAG: hypothetical protein WA197_24370, partial [Candidatus Acidiferrales bacterium]
PKRRLIAFRVRMNHYAGAVLKQVVQKVDDGEWRKRSSIGEGQLEVGEGIGSLLNLRVKGGQGRIGNRTKKISAPGVVPLFLRHSHQRSESLRLLQVEGFQGVALMLDKSPKI